MTRLIASEHALRALLLLSQHGSDRRASQVAEALERLLRAYLAAREPGEDLRAYFARTDDESLRAQLAGTVVTPVERDAPPVGAGRHAPGE